MDGHRDASQDLRISRADEIGSGGVYVSLDTGRVFRCARPSEAPAGPVANELVARLSQDPQTSFEDLREIVSRLGIRLTLAF